MEGTSGSDKRLARAREKEEEATKAGIMKRDKGIIRRLMEAKSILCMLYFSLMTSFRRSESSTVSEGGHSQLLLTSQASEQKRTLTQQLGSTGANPYSLLMSTCCFQHRL